MVIPELFYIELCMKPIGVGLNLAFLKGGISSVTPAFILFSERYDNSP